MLSGVGSMFQKLRSYVEMNKKVGRVGLCFFVLFTNKNLQST
jgi:hypothetical protein